MTWVTALSDRLLVQPDDRSQAARVSIDCALPGVVGASAFLDLCLLIGEAADPAATLSALSESPALTAKDLAGELLILALAMVRGSYAAQSDAVAARDALSIKAQSAYGPIGDAFGYDVLDFVVRLIGQASIELSRIAANRSPLVRVEAGVSLPSSLLAYDLYGDPSRGAEIVKRNRSGTPMLMPAVFEALGT